MVDKDILDSVRSGGEDDDEGEEKATSSSEANKTRKTTKSSCSDRKVKIELFEALGKTFSITKAMKDPFGDKDVPSKRKAVWKKTARDIHECGLDHFGVYGVYSIAQEHGFDWDKITDTREAGQGNDKDLSKNDAEKILKAMGNISLRAKGIVIQKSNEIDDGADSDNNVTSMKAAKEIYANVGAILRRYNVQRHAERFGLDWDQDILKDIVENQPEMKEKVLEET